MLELGAYESMFDGEVIVPGDTLEERLATLESLGYQGIQLRRRTVARLGTAAIKKAFAHSTIRLCVYWEPWHGRGGRGGLVAADKETRAAAVKQMKQWLEHAAELGAIGTTTGVRPEIAHPDPPQSLRELEMEILVEQLCHVASTAEETGTAVILEPINRYESHFLNTLEQGVKICQAVGSPGVRIMADFFHMNIEEADIARSIEEAADYISYVHLADSNRFQPGAGHLDFRPGLAALKRINYVGFMTLECWVMGEDKVQALAECAQHVRSIYDQL